MSAYTETLAPYFSQIDQAENGHEVVSKVLSHAPSYYAVIILDIQMPIMDGIEACKKIKEYFAKTPDRKAMNPSTSKREGSDLL